MRSGAPEAISVEGHEQAASPGQLPSLSFPPSQPAVANRTLSKDEGLAALSLPLDRWWEAPVLRAGSEKQLPALRPLPATEVLRSFGFW